MRCGCNKLAIETMNGTGSMEIASTILALEHLTGPSQGEVSWLTGRDTTVGLTLGRRVVLADNDGASLQRRVARISANGSDIAIESAPGAQIWVNGRLIERQALKDKDVIEFCADGPISRLRVYHQGDRPRHTFGRIMADTATYLRVSHQPWHRRIWRAFISLIRQLVTRTSLVFRLSVVVALVVLASLLYEQHQENRRLQEDLALSARQLQSFSTALARAREEALTPADLRTLRTELAERLGSAAGRIEALERSVRAFETVIAGARPSVVFLQGAYGFREENSGRYLRHHVDADGRKLMSPMGQPFVSLKGNGPVAERPYTGTGFVVAGTNQIATNRHVALPWERDATADALASQGLRPEMLRFIAYFPGLPDGAVVVLHRTSEAADLAVLRLTEERFEPLPEGLPLAEAPPPLGAAVIVMGFPTGLRSLLVQTGEGFVKKLQADGVTDFWEVAQRIAREGYIAPLSSRGIIGQATEAAIVYDAETTHGGSGGPVLNTRGEVVAVNAAILPEYGGSNIGVPVALLKALFESKEGPRP